jgi:hypothetical protein
VQRRAREDRGHHWVPRADWERAQAKAARELAKQERVTAAFRDEHAAALVESVQSVRARRALYEHLLRQGSSDFQNGLTPEPLLAPTSMNLGLVVLNDDGSTYFSERETEASFGDASRANGSIALVASGPPGGEDVLLRVLAPPP